MVITYYGLSCFKIQNGETVLVVDPFAKESGLTPPRFQAHVLVSTNSDPNHANIETIAGDPFVINTPGEFEVQNIFIQGFPSARKGKDAGETNTIYVIDWDGMRLCHLGNITKSNLTEELKESIGPIDILFVPVGGGDTLDPEEAAVVTNQIEPRVIIPMRYKLPGVKLSLAGVEQFVTELGGEKPSAEEKFTFKKKDLPQDGTRLVVLTPAR